MIKKVFCDVLMEASANRIADMERQAGEHQANGNDGGNGGGGNDGNGGNGGNGGGGDGQHGSGGGGGAPRRGSNDSDDADDGSDEPGPKRARTPTAGRKKNTTPKKPTTPAQAGLATQQVSQAQGTAIITVACPAAVSKCMEPSGPCSLATSQADSCCGDGHRLTGNAVMLCHHTTLPMHCQMATAG